MANTSPKKHTAGFTLRVDPEFTRMIEDLQLYEAQHGLIQSKSDIVRALVAEAWELRCRKKK